MKHSLLAIALGLLTAPAFAQGTTELAKQYVNMPEVQNMITEMFSPTAMGNQIAARLPAGMALSEVKKQQIGLIMSAAMNDLRPNLEESMISTSSEMFSADELQALIEFYSSEYGASVMMKMTPFMAKVMGQLQPEIQALQRRVAPEIEKVLQN